MTGLAGDKASGEAESQGQAGSTIPVTCHGVTGKLGITADLGVAFGLVEVRSTDTHLICSATAWKGRQHEASLKGLGGHQSFG